MVAQRKTTCVSQHSSTWCIDASRTRYLHGNLHGVHEILRFGFCNYKIQRSDRRTYQVQNGQCSKSKPSIRKVKHVVRTASEDSITGVTLSLLLFFILASSVTNFFCSCFSELLTLRFSSEADLSSLSGPHVTVPVKVWLCHH